MQKTEKVVDQSQYEHDYGIMNEAQIKEALKPTIQNLIYNTVRRFENGSCSNYFSEPEMIALSEDLLMKTTERVLLYQKNDKDPKGVNPRGMKNWFSKCFKNQVQKDYEKYAKTDIRAGVQTVSSDEALTVAASKNLVNPEDHYVLMEEFKYVIKQLEAQDAKHNNQVLEKYNLKNHTPSPNNLSHNATIIEMYLQGYKPEEIKDELKLTDSEFGKHRNTALNHAKDLFPSKYEDLLEHLDTAVDLRIFTREVKKRQKKSARLKNTFDLISQCYIDTLYLNRAYQCSLPLSKNLTALLSELSYNVKDKFLVLSEETKENLKEQIPTLNLKGYSSEDQTTLKNILEDTNSEHIVVSLRSKLSYMYSDEKSKDLPSVIRVITSIYCTNENEATEAVNDLRSRMESSEIKSKIDLIKQELINDHADLKINCN